MRLPRPQKTRSRNDEKNSLLKSFIAFPSPPQSLLMGESEDEGGIITPLCSRFTTH